MFPQFQFEFFPSQIFWTVLSFGSCYAFCSKFLVPRIALYKDGAESLVHNNLAKAEKIAQDAENLRKEVVKEKRDYDNKVMSMLSDADSKIARVTSEMNYKMSVSATRILNLAKEDVKSEIEKCRNDLLAVNVDSSEKISSFFANRKCKYDDNFKQLIELNLDFKINSLFNN